MQVVSNNTKFLFQQQAIMDAVEAYLSANNGVKPVVGCGLLDDEAAVEPIQDALYATGRFTTDECNVLSEGILRYIKDAEIMMVVKQ